MKTLLTSEGHYPGQAFQEQTLVETCGDPRDREAGCPPTQLPPHLSSTCSSASCSRSRCSCCSRTCCIHATSARACSRRAECSRWVSSSFSRSACRMRLSASWREEEGGGGLWARAEPLLSGPGTESRHSGSCQMFPRRGGGGWDGCRRHQRPRSCSLPQGRALPHHPQSLPSDTSAGSALGTQTDSNPTSKNTDHRRTRAVYAQKSLQPS